MTSVSRTTCSLLALRVGGVIGGLSWWLCIKAYSSRSMFLLDYGSQALVSPRWEVFVPTRAATLVVALCGLAFWLCAGEFLWRRLSGRDADPQAAARRQWTRGVGFLIAASVPWLSDLAIHWNLAQQLTRADGIWGPTVWQPLWLAACSGLAADRFVRAVEMSRHGMPAGRTSTLITSSRWLSASVVAAAALCGLWWFVQSQRAFDGFMLGFNDCGHFAQRVANTAAGRGWLIESPVLPPFWDHFNPGLTLLTPLWMARPGMPLFFFLQALSLAGCAPLIMQVARALGAPPLVAAMWALAWLVQPVLGQMNLAYTYGWHPVSLAIPLLLVALLCLLKQRWWGAALAAILASSMEEGVLVIIATTAATLGAIELLSWLAQRSTGADARSGAVLEKLAANCAAARRVSAILPARTWCAIAALATLAFILVFRLSGLAEFQTGRFHQLGNSALEIILSPVLRPDVFWGLLFRSRNAIFLAGMLLPCCVMALMRAWPLLLATVLPLGVLVVWEHLPAQSLAFHYSSVLLPVFWLTAITGAMAGPNRKTTEPAAANRMGRDVAGSALSFAAAALMTSLVASISFGALPWSCRTLVDVYVITYGPNPTLDRGLGTDDNRFAHEQLAAIGKQGQSVLATGRLATHLVGCDELETVGQFDQRRKALAELTPGEHPLRRYRWLILDRREGFQQSLEQTEALEQEALANGFSPVADQFDIVVLSRE